jgi:hypothetical protein
VNAFLNKIARLEDEVERLTEERDRLGRGMRMARARHLRNEHAAAEALTAWTLNGNDPDEWNPHPNEWGTASEERFRSLVGTNRDIGAITAEAHDDYLPRVALSESSITQIEQN